MHQGSQYKKLGREFDKAIAKYGSEKLIEILNILNQDDESQIIILVFRAASEYFNIPIDELVELSSKQHFEQRSICYYLIKKNIPSYSIAKIASLCNRGKQPIHRGIKEVTYHLAKPQLYQKQVSDFNEVEKRFEDYKSKVQLSKL